MKRAGFWGVAAALTGGIAIGLVVLVQTTHGQTWTERPERAEALRHVALLAGPGPAIGVSVRDVSADEAKTARLSAPSGAFVEAVTEGGPAAEAGLEKGDVLVAFDGETVRSARQLSRLVEETPAGRTVTATIVRNGTRSDVQVTPRDGVEDARRRALLMRRPGGPGRDEFVFEMPDLPALDELRQQFGGLGRSGRLGVSVQDLTPELAAHFGAKQGVLVSAVRDDSPASRAGIRVGDVITMAAGEPVDSASDLRATLWRDPEATEVVVGLVRDKVTQSVTVTFDAPPVRQTSPRRWTM